MNFIKYLLLYISLYIYLYNPIFQSLGFGSIKILLLVSFAICLLYNKSFFYFLGRIKHEILLAILLVFYSTFTSIWGDNKGYVIGYVHFIWFLECFTIPFALFRIYKLIDGIEALNRHVVFVGFIAALITTGLIVNPDWNFYVRQNIILDSLDSQDADWSFRGFSIAESSSFGYGIVQAMIFGIALLHLKENKFFLIVLIPLTISVFFNTRTGLSVQALSILFFLFTVRKNIIPLILIVLLILFTFNSSFFETFLMENEQSLKWGLQSIDEVGGFLTEGDQDNTIGVLFNYMFFLPNNLFGFLFGEGIDLYYRNNLYRIRSDIGYVLQMFRGGLVYISLILLFLMFLYRRFLKLKLDKRLIIFFMLVLLLSNIKGSVMFYPNSIFRLIMLYYVFAIMLDGKFILRKHKL